MDSLSTFGLIRKRLPIGINHLSQSRTRWQSCASSTRNIDNDRLKLPPSAPFLLNMGFKISLPSLINQ